MRVTTLFRQVLDVTQMWVRAVRFEPVGVVVSVVPSWKRPRCGECGKVAAKYDQRPSRRWRHLGLGSVKIWFEYAPRRVECPECGVRVESVPWAEHRSRFTRDFEELTAYLTQSSDKTKVTELMGISWSTVGDIVERVVERKKDPECLRNLRFIGIDDFSYRKRHRYLTTVVNHESRRVVWASAGRDAATLKSFFEELGTEACGKIEAVTIDMAGGYLKAINDCLPNAQVVFDRFHVQRLASDSLDEVRREQLRETRGTPEGRDLFKSRFALLKNPWNLNRSEHEKLDHLQKTNARLYRAYLLKETLAQALDYRQPWRARRALEEWLAWASRSKLKPFVKTARTIRKHFEGVLAYVELRLTNGVVEGINTRLRMIARRAFGFHRPEPLIAMLFLCCSGIVLSPPLP